MEKEVADHLVEALVAREKVAHEYKTLTSKVIPAEGCTGEDLASFAAEILMMWRPYDTRWYLAAFPHSGYKFEPSTLSLRLMRHSKVEVLGIGEGEFEFGLFLNANIKDFEAYDSMVEKSWRTDRETVKVDKFGRLQGSVLTLQGGTPGYAKSPSPHMIKMPESLFVNDRLAAPMPEADWRLKVVVTCKVSIISDYYVIDYVAKGSKGLLYDGRITDENLLEATRIVMHTLFGSQEEDMVAGDFMDGIRQLMAGEKAPGYVPSGAVVYAEMGRKAVKVNRVSLYLAVAILLVGVFKDGWFIGWEFILASAIVAIIGQSVTAVMVPIFEAKERRTSAKSIE